MKKRIGLSALGIACLIGLGFYFYFSWDTVLSSEEKRIMQELVRYDLADSLLQNPDELAVTFSSVVFENFQEDVDIAEYIVQGEYGGETLQWRVWKNTSDHPIWGYSSRECISGCPDSPAFTSIEDMHTFMQLHWLKRKHNELVDECRCSNVVAESDTLPIIHVSDETKEYISNVRMDQDTISISEQRALVDSSIELISETAILYGVDLKDKNAYQYFLNDVTRYLQFDMMRYWEIRDTYGIDSDEIIAFYNEATSYEYDDGGGFGSILSGMDYYNGPTSYKEEQAAFESLLVPVYRLIEFSWLHALYHETTNEFLRDIKNEQKAIAAAYSNHKEIFDSYNLNASLFDLEKLSLDTKKEEKEVETVQEEVQEEVQEKPSINTSVSCGNGDPLLTSTVESRMISLQSDDATFQTLNDSYAGGEAGDTIAEGTFYLCVDSAYKLPISITNFNLQNERLYYSVSGEPELLVVEEFGASAGNYAYLFAFDGETLYPISIGPDYDSIFTLTQLKPSGKARYQYMTYDNTSGTFYVHELTLLTDSMSAKIETLTEMTDRITFDQFVQNPDYIYSQ